MAQGKPRDERKERHGAARFAPFREREEGERKGEAKERDRVEEEDRARPPLRQVAVEHSLWNRRDGVEPGGQG